MTDFKEIPAKGKHIRLSSRIKKNIAIEVCKKSLGNISDICEKAEISRKTFYKWRKEDKKFAQAIDELEIPESILDFAESALYKNVREGNQRAIEYLLNNKGKSRGYSQQQGFEQAIKNIVIEFKE